MTTKIKKIYQELPREASILNQQSESQMDTYSCDFINQIAASGTGIIEIHEETNALTLPSGVYTVAKDSTGSLYIPVVENGNPNVANSCWEIDYERCGQSIAVISNTCWDEDGEIIDPSDTENVDFQDAYVVVNGCVSQLIKKNRWDITEWKINFFKMADYEKGYCTLAPFVDEDTLPGLLPVRTMDTLSNVTNSVFKTPINILTTEQTWNLSSSFSDSVGTEVIFPAYTMFIGSGKDLMATSKPCGIITPTGDRYVITFGSAAMWGGHKIADGGNKISITDEEPAAAHDGDLWINSDEIGTVESEVVNSLDGNETAKAPSAKAVNDILALKQNKLKIVTKSLTTDSSGNAYLGFSTNDTIVLAVYQKGTTFNAWQTLYVYNTSYYLHTGNFNGTAVAGTGTFEIVYIER